MKFNKHVVIFSPGFPRDESDGSCIPTLQNYVKALAASGEWEVTVLSLHYPFENREYRWHGIRVIALGGANVKYPKRFLLWKQAWKSLKQLHRKQPIDVVHSFWMHECALLGNIFAKRKGLGHLVTLMGQDLRPPNHFASRVDQGYAVLVALSEFQPQRQQAGIRKPDAIIPFGIPSGERQWLAPLPENVDVLGVGSLIPLKDYEGFIHVIARLREVHPTITAHIVGEGEQHQYLQNLIDDLGMQENIKLVGQLSRPAVYRKMCQSKVFLHTSRYETQGYVFNEALTAGLPIVSTEVGIAREETFWKLGRDENELAEAVAQFLKKPVEIPPEAHLDVEHTLSAYLDLCERLLRSRATRAATKR